MSNFQEEISEWIIGPLSKANPDFGGLPACPFARKAVVYGQVVIKKIRQYELEFTLMDLMSNFPEGKRVAVIAMDPEDIKPYALSTIARIYSNPKYIVLEDHPDEVEKIGETVVNNGKYALVIVQPREDIVEARKQLEGTDYYKNFDDAYKQDLSSR